MCTEEETLEELTPYTEEDLSLLYPNPQLDANQFFIDNFVKVSINWSEHYLEVCMICIMVLTII